MEQTLTVWLVPAATLIIGVVIGLVVARLLPGTVPGRTQRQLDDMQVRFEAYQNEVVTHFNTTANLVKKLTQSYQDVQQHLSEGANRLAQDDLTRQRLMASLSGAEPVEKRDRLTPPKDFEMPKDYAPKSDGPGMLDESYGLKR